MNGKQRHYIALQVALICLMLFFGYSLRENVVVFLFGYAVGFVGRMIYQLQMESGR